MKYIFNDLYWQLKNGLVDDAIKYLKCLTLEAIYLKFPFLAEKDKALKELINYIENNKDGIKVYKEDWYMGSCTEAQVSHNVK
jgi:adenylate kinase family enzyme